MIRHKVAWACVVALLAAAPVYGQDSKGAFFNGKDLSGWQGLDKYWSVKDGTLIGSTEPDGLGFNTFLCSKRPYQDFELKYKIRLKGGKGNSGVQIRSGVFNLETYAVLGPQCDIGDIYWGSLYGEHFGGMMKQGDKDTVAKVLKKEDFNDYHIKCLGQHVTIKLNGATTVDADFEKMPDIGLIAFQVHAGGPMEVTFKEIQFREIKKEKTAAVAGKLVFEDGTPTKELAGGMVVLDAPDTGHEARGKINEDGSFVLTTYRSNDGAVPGSYRVYILPPPPADPKKPAVLRPVYLSPETSGLQVTVTPQKNEFVIKLAK